MNLLRRTKNVFIYVILVLCILFVLSWILIDVPIKESEVYPSGTIIRSSDSTLLRVSLGKGDVDCRPYYKFDKNDYIIPAIISSEDKRFYTHSGVDFKSLLRAIQQNVFSLRRVSGASTITMQTVRMITPHKRTLFWKYVEMFQAWKLELQLSKEEILEQYLNRSPFGSNLVGIEAAAQGWFGKSAKDLSIGEAALLAGMVQSPSRFRPDRHMDRAISRREYVLERMQDLGYITQEQFDDAKNAPLMIKRSIRPFTYPYFCDWVMSNDKTHSRDITTALDLSLQERVSKIIEFDSKDKDVAVVVLDVKSGSIISYQCSGDYFSTDSGQVNTAISPRHAGSTLKPFLAAYALDRGVVAPSSVLADIPKYYNGYMPQNFSTKFYGLVSLKDSLVLSLNIPFFEMVSKVGQSNFMTLLRSLGFAYMRKHDSHYGLGIVTGNAQVTLVELVNAYATIARGGVYKPIAYELNNDSSDGMRIFSEEACYVISEMLSGEERSQASIGHSSLVYLPKFAWKTGTSSAHRDAWTIAWNPEYVVGVWSGYKSGEFGNSKIVGIDSSAPIAWKVIRELCNTHSTPWYTRPTGILIRDVCSTSGMLASRQCVKHEPAMFIKNSSPRELCNVHRYNVNGEIEECWSDDIKSFLDAKDSKTFVSIISPKRNAVYELFPNLPEQAIVYKVTSSPQDTMIWWSVNNVLVTNLSSHIPFIIKQPQPGVYNVRASTMFGDYDTIQTEVKELE